jgi:hypothetical protein
MNLSYRFVFHFTFYNIPNNTTIMPNKRKYFYMKTLALPTKKNIAI